MTKLYNYYILLIIALGLTSCDDNLEINPRQDIDGSQVFTSEQNIDALLLGIYQDSGQDLSYGGDIQITNDLIGTSDQVSWFGTFVQPRQFIQKNILVDNSFVRDTWANNYESINQSNLIIDNLDIVTSSDDLIFQFLRPFFRRGSVCGIPPIYTVVPHLRDTCTR